jgi:hypothetical protein
VARARRAARARLERDSREKEWEERRKSEMPDEGPKALPFTDDLTYLDNMISHLKALLPKEAADEEKKAEDTAGANAPAGGLVLMGKNQREEEFFFAPTKKKQLKKKGSGGKAKPLVHSMETLSFFEKYKVPPPPDATAVPEALKAVEEKVKEYKEKQAKEVEKMKKKEESKGEEKTEDAPAEEAADAKEAVEA